jgi:hypothetical protein
MSDAPHASDPQYKYQVHTRPVPHLANFCCLHALGLRRHRRLDRLRSTPRRRQRLWSAPSTASPPEHTVVSIASPSTPLDHFALDLDRFARSTPPSPAMGHTVDLDRFTDTPDGVLHSTPSFPSPQVIHEELVNCCLVLIVHCSYLFTYKYVIRFLHKNFAIYICVV